ncbi:MAG TPA: hypothetical protein VMV32_04010 [Ignavibacteriaceae bacterium]|nr:hypothetical protein [Ignavibacteriaceae bacterium]
MNRSLVFVGVILFILTFFSGCSSNINNSITFKNLASGDVYINFRGGLITVPAGQTSSITEIPNGTYDYSTTYTVPAGASSSSTVGNTSGTLVIKAGTKILFVYSSTLQSGAYVLSITISNSDNQGSSSLTGP